MKTYKDSVTHYIAKINPTIKPPLSPTRDVLETLGATDHFWSDAYFEHADELWATDPLVREGIKWMLQAVRATEEIRRLGWEIRRCLGLGGGTSYKTGKCLQAVDAV